MFTLHHWKNLVPWFSVVAYFLAAIHASGAFDAQGSTRYPGRGISSVSGPVHLAERDQSSNAVEVFCSSPENDGYVCWLGWLTDSLFGKTLAFLAEIWSDLVPTSPCPDNCPLCSVAKMPVTSGGIGLAIPLVIQMDIVMVFPSHYQFPQQTSQLFRPPRLS